LLPNGRENCGYWEVGSIEGEPGKSLKINLRGATRGLWTDFSAAKGSPGYSGNVIQLVAQVQFGGDVGRACQWLRSWLGLDISTPSGSPRRRPRRSARPSGDQGRAEPKAEKNRRRAHTCILSAEPYPGTIAETYLVERPRFRARPGCTRRRDPLPSRSLLRRDARPSCRR
jgi:hypothetical protein